MLLKVVVEVPSNNIILDAVIGHSSVLFDYIEKYIHCKTKYTEESIERELPGKRYVNQARV